MSPEDFLKAVQEKPSTSTLTAGVHAFAWYGTEVPPLAPDGYGGVATELSKLAAWQGLDRWKGADPRAYREAAFRLVGLRELVEAGKVRHVAPGEAFALGMAEPTADWNGQHLPTVALEVGRRAVEPDAVDSEIEDLFEGTAEVRRAG